MAFDGLRTIRADPDRNNLALMADVALGQSVG